MLGVRADGRRELVALTDGYRESTESWTDLLRDCRRRERYSPRPGSSAAGYIMLAALPKSAHPGALAATKGIYNAEDIDKAQLTIGAFARGYGAKCPKAVAKITGDADVLLEFFKRQGRALAHLRAIDPVESVYSPPCVCGRRSPKGPGSRAAGMVMVPTS